MQLCYKLIQILQGMAVVPNELIGLYTQMKSESQAEIQLLTNDMKKLEAKAKEEAKPQVELGDINVEVITAHQESHTSDSHREVVVDQDSSYDMDKINKFLDQIRKDPRNISNYI